jgi:tetratricopeptide (TPR) repeat protein/SH3-like domain-containing protein
MKQVIYQPHVAAVQRTMKKVFSTTGGFNMKKWTAAVFLAATFIGGGFARAQDATPSAACDLKDVAAFVSRGDGKYQSKDYAGAAADYTCALALDANNYDVLVAQGGAYYELKQYDKANIAFQAAAKINPKDPDLYIDLGNMAAVRGDLQEAMADYNKALELGTTGAHVAYNNLGATALDQGNYDQAVTYFNQSLKARPNYSNAYLGLAIAYFNLEKSDLANQNFFSYVNAIQYNIQSATVTLPVKEQSFDMTEGTVYYIPFTAKAGQTIRAAATTAADSQLDPLLVLLGPDGKPVAADDDSGVNLDAVFNTTIKADGKYTLLLTHAGGGSKGTAYLSLDVGEDAGAAQDFTAYDLKVGIPAVVYTTAGDHLNLRSGPGLNFDILLKLERNTLVTLLEGPRKSDGYAWWRVRTSDGKEGWAVERVDQEQTLQPALMLGKGAVVHSTAGDKLNVRADAGKGAAIVTKLSDGDTVTVLDGPRAADGYIWWKVRTADNLEGWAVYFADGEQTLVYQGK